MPIDLKDNTKSFELLPAARATTTANGTGIDRQGSEGRVIAILSSAAGTGTAPTMDVKLQESDVLASGYADITGAVFTQVAGVAAFQTIAVDLRTAKRFIRAVETIAGGTPVFDRACVLVVAPKEVPLA